MSDDFQEVSKKEQNPHNKLVDSDVYESEEFKKEFEVFDAPDANPFLQSQFNIVINSKEEVNKIVRCIEVVDRGQSILDQYKEYKFEITLPGEEPVVITRRFSDFAKLHKYLESEYSHSFIPHLPEKNAFAIVRNLASVDFIKQRQQALELFIWKLLGHSVCNKDSKMQEFIKNGKFEVDVGTSRILSISSDVQESTIKFTGKAKNFLTSIFSKNTPQQKSIHKSEEEVNLESEKSSFIPIQSNLDNILYHVDCVFKKIEEKAQASEAQRAVFDKMAGCASIGTNEYFGVNKDTLEGFRKIHEELAIKFHSESQFIKENIWFFLYDTRNDIVEALLRSENKLSKAAELREKLGNCNSNSGLILSSQFENLKAELRVFTSELAQAREQISSNLRILIAGFFDYTSESYKSQSEIWSNLDINKISD